MDIRNDLKESILLFDGAMGTYYSARCHRISSNCERANLEDPALVESIHREYLEAGCRALKTNTFGVNPAACGGDDALLRRLVGAGVDLAARAAGGRAYVFGDIGPINGVDEKEAAAGYRAVADALLEKDVGHFLFETNSTDSGLLQAAAYIRARQPDAYIITSFAVQPDGYTRHGYHYARMFRQLRDSGLVDAVGFNCVSSARHMALLLQGLTVDGITISAMPNAGYPVVIRNRTFYDGDPDYFAQQMKAIAEAGAGILGGCCGTTPLHIARTRAALAGQRPHKRIIPAAAGPAPVSVRSDNSFRDKLEAGRKVIALELDPPRDTDLEGFLRNAQRIKASGADILTIADCPVARARMDSSLLACKVRYELKMDVLPHLTCRDRNLNATKALVLGLYAEGVRNLLAVTGDPVPTAERDEVRSVYQFNSRRLAQFLTSLGEQELPSPLCVFGALNLNALNFDVQLSIAREKLKNGMYGFLTQPVLTRQAFENLQRARRELDAKILGGIIPIVSAKNARFMESEVNGIRVDPELTQRYEGKTREEGEALAYDVSVEIARRIAPFVDGFYLITPFSRVGLMERIIRAVAALEGSDPHRQD